MYIFHLRGFFFAEDIQSLCPGLSCYTEKILEKTRYVSSSYHYAPMNSFQR